MPKKKDKPKYNQPLSGNDMPRYAAATNFMRLPSSKIDSNLDVAFVGIPLDIGASNRPGARFAPREIRDESRMMRPFNVSTGAAPFESLQVADIGDIPINSFNLQKSISIITEYIAKILAKDIIPLSIGGDHTVTYPILQAIKEKHGAIALIHIDAHADVNDTMMGEKIAHGTPFRRAIEEGLIECKKAFQIGLRGTGYSPQEFHWQQKKGVKVIPVEECWHKSLSPLMKKVCQKIGNHPVYLSFDIDSLDPAFAPGTGTAEIGGLTIYQALEIIRGCKGLNLIGADLVEVSPPFDLSKNTSLVAANLLFEILCVLPKVRYY